MITGANVSRTRKNVYLYGAVEKAIILSGSIKQTLRAGKTGILVDLLLSLVQEVTLTMLTVMLLQVAGIIDGILRRGLMLQAHR